MGVEGDVRIQESREKLMDPSTYNVSTGQRRSCLSLVLYWYNE